VVVEGLQIVEHGCLACCRVGQTARCNSSDLSVANKLSAAALSKQVPGRPGLHGGWAWAVRPAAIEVAFEQGATGKGSSPTAIAAGHGGSRSRLVMDTSFRKAASPARTADDPR
jgi:hypothetical protein